MRNYPDNNDPGLLALFPGTATTLGRGGNEVNGLSKDAIPKGNILGSGMRDRESDRVFHVVDSNNERFYLRVCTAMPGEGYEAFAVIHDRAQIGTPKADEMLARYQESVQRGFFTELPAENPTIEAGSAFMKSQHKPTSPGYGL